MRHPHDQADIRISQPRIGNPGFGRVPCLSPPAPGCRWPFKCAAGRFLPVVAWRWLLIREPTNLKPLNDNPWYLYSKWFLGSWLQNAVMNDDCHGVTFYHESWASLWVHINLKKLFIKDFKWGWGPPNFRNLPNAPVFMSTSFGVATASWAMQLIEIP